ncbi:unnamed protein product, partial [Nesidiocoris tenuis]
MSSLMMDDHAGFRVMMKSVFRNRPMPISDFLGKNRVYLPIRTKCGPFVDAGPPSSPESFGRDDQREGIKLTSSRMRNLIGLQVRVRFEQLASLNRKYLPLQQSHQNRS